MNFLVEATRNGKIKMATHQVSIKSLTTRSLVDRRWCSALCPSASKNGDASHTGQSCQCVASSYGIVGLLSGGWGVDYLQF
jgi:hypothetical protein